MSRQIHYSVDDRGIATIAIEGFNKFNAITSAMFGELADCFERTDKDPNVKVVIFRGYGEENFSSGADLKETEERRSRNNVADYSAPHALARQRRNFWYPHDTAGLTTRIRFGGFQGRIPCIGAFSGYCLAAAMLMAMSHTTLRIAGKSASFGFPEIRFGGGQGIGMSTLGCQVQSAPLQRLAVCMDYVGAEDALAMGMVNEVVPDELLFQRVQQLAEEIALQERLPIMAEKRGIQAAHNQPQKVIAELAAQVSAAVHFGI